MDQNVAALLVQAQRPGAVGLMAIQQGVARRSATKTKLIEHATKLIQRAQRQTRIMRRKELMSRARKLSSIRL